MCYSCTSHQTKYCDGGVCVSFPSQNQLTKRAASKKDTAKSCKRHSKCIPKTICMCDRLSCKSWIKISQDHVSDQRTYQNCNKSKKQLPLSKQYHVTDSSNHTQAGSLCKCTYQKPCDQGDCNCSMLCSRTTVSFCEVDECRCCNEKQKNSDFHYWENAAFNRLHFIGTFQSIAFFQEKYSGKDSSKVDRSAAYMARYLAKNVVAAGLADRCEVQLSYAIGVAQPVSVLVDTFGTEKVDREKIQALVSAVDMRPAAIIKRFDLRSPRFSKVSCYGHFGENAKDMPWEKTDLAEGWKMA